MCFSVWGMRHHYAIYYQDYVQLCVSTICWTVHKHTVSKYCTYEESTCIHENRDSKTVLTLLKCFLIKDMANAELISYEDIYTNILL